jgi:hypothetical protein
MKNLNRHILIASLAAFAMFAVSCAKTETSDAAKADEAAAEAAADATPEAGDALAANAGTPAGTPAASSTRRPAGTTPKSSGGSGNPAANNATPTAQSGGSVANGWGDQPQSKPAASTVPAAPVYTTYTLPSGSSVRVRTTSTLSSKTANTGSTFAASLVEPLIVDGRVIAERGANVVGRVVNVDDGGRVKGKAYLEVAVSSLELVNGDTVSVETATVGQEAKSSTKKDATKIAIGSGIGAAIGAIAGGGKGAAIGAGVGAGAGTGTVLATKGEAAVIPAESVLEFRTQSPISVKLK